MTVLELAQKLARPLSILVVDDDPGVRIWLKSALSKFNAELTLISTMSEGVHRAREFSYDIAFVDLVLPDGDGVAIVKELKKTVGTPVVLMTGFQDSPLIAKALSCGAAVLLRKPEDFIQARIDETLTMLNVRARPCAPAPQLNVALAGSI